ncbi:MAG: hypothetical protein ABSG03_36480 [Bryobacteraceae bacterium]|jgi:hypothetical protein
MVRVLLDENIPKALRKALGGFDVSTVQYMGWAGLKNGELLSAAEAAGFDVFVTGDKTVQFEQNMSRWKIAVVSLSAPHWPIVKNHVKRIALASKEQHQARSRGSMWEASAGRKVLRVRLVRRWGSGNCRYLVVRCLCRVEMGALGGDDD